MDKPSEQRLFEFDDFRFDAEHLMLYRSDVEIPLVPKAARTLLALIERGGRIVSKEELLDAVWPDTTVEESNLFSYLTLLRKALGNQENGEPYLETLRRRGYRFNGKARLTLKETNSSTADIAFSEEPIPWKGPATGRKRYVLAMSIGAVTMVALFAASFYWRPGMTEEGNVSEKHQTSSEEAYEYYQAGRYNVYKIGGESMRQGILFYEKAVIADPNYALAYAEMGDAYRRLASAGLAAPKEVCPKARAYATKALQLDESLPQAHVTLGWVDYMYDHDWKAAEIKFKRAIDLAPAGADGYFAYAHFLSDAGRHDEARAKIKRARALSPTTLITIAVESMILNAAGREDEAVVEAKKTLDLDQDFWPAHLQLGLAYYRQGRFDDAIRSLEKARQLEPGAYQAQSSLGLVYAVMGNKQLAYAAIREMEESSGDRHFPYHKIAAIYNALGQSETAFELLQRALEERETHLVDIRYEKSWDNLREDPRFIDILAKMNLEH